MSILKFRVSRSPDLCKQFLACVIVFEILKITLDKMMSKAILSDRMYCPQLWTVIQSVRKYANTVKTCLARHLPSSVEKNPMNGSSTFFYKEVCCTCHRCSNCQTWTLCPRKVKSPVWQVLLYSNKNLVTKLHCKENRDVFCKFEKLKPTELVA